MEEIRLGTVGSGVIVESILDQVDKTEALAEARKRAFDSSFVRDHLPLSLIEYFCNR